MIRLHIVAEGQAEEAFVNTSLAIHLGAFDISTDVRCVQTSRARHHTFRGGVSKYLKIKRDLQRWMKQDQAPDSFFTTMFDLYQLPKDFPEFERAKKAGDPYSRVHLLEKAFADDVSHLRFVPYIQLYEFEALLLSDPSQFATQFLDHDAPIKCLIDMVAQHGSPELIDDGPDTAPSKRIIEKIPEYKGAKVSAGPLIAGKIGISAIRRRCSHWTPRAPHPSPFPGRPRPRWR